ncbi:hypothetical protein PISMIDRAFT_334368 [Pisolithus microcarpus 441]|uniref:Uncharacterized protein n=1 Tax=Pisolithus microcarpus 441 TaxID=765257 RepID=A0A0C9ZI92_9AGAM|nr:hypothetical protein BKA83DRAFT_334368 [Pisolithus microcarpus]KIK25714.1 hypothetical protein PISMIDRAFT_334368 [Pisolithus microcarpus 441]
MYYRPSVLCTRRAWTTVARCSKIDAKQDQTKFVALVPSFYRRVRCPTIFCWHRSYVGVLAMVCKAMSVYPLVMLCLYLNCTEYCCWYALVVS